MHAYYGAPTIAATGSLHNDRHVGSSTLLPFDPQGQSLPRAPRVLGMQVCRDKGFEVRAEYNPQASDDFVSQTGSLRAVWHF